MPTGVSIQSHSAEVLEVVGKALAPRQCMQKGEMRRVHAVFFDLQPVAFPDRRRARDLAVAGQVKGVEHREIGLLVGRPHIGEHQPLIFAHRVGAVAQPVLEGAVGRLARGFEDRAVGSEQPAVIAAANARLADQPEFERGAAMRAMQFQQPDLAALVAKGDEVLAEDAQPPRHLAQLRGLDDRLPEPPQIFAAGRARADPGQFLVYRRTIAMVIGAVGTVQKGCSFRHRLLHDARVWRSG